MNKQFKKTGLLLTVFVAAIFGASGNALAAFDWFHPEGIILVGGQNPPYVEATASPEILRANIVEAAMELAKSMPGRQIGIGMFWDRTGPKEFSDKHYDAMVLGFRQAAEILGGTGNVVFLPWGGFDDEVLEKFRAEIGINVGRVNFRHWRYNCTDSRELAETRLKDLARLSKNGKEYKSDMVHDKYKFYETKNMVCIPLVSGNGGAVPGSQGYTVPDGKEDLWDPHVIQAWATMTRYYTELFSGYDSFTGIAFDEPYIQLMDKKYRESAGAKARYKYLYDEEMPEYPEKIEDRKGEKFVRLVNFLKGGINPLVEACRDTMHQTASWSQFTTPLVSVENPFFAYDHLRPSLDILQCDPYAYWDFQVTNTGFEWQIYDDCYDTVQTRAKVHVVFPRRIVWKYFSDKYSYMHGEPMTLVRNFRHLTPLVDMINDDIVFRWLDRIDGVLVWPIGRVTSKAEDEKLVEWVKKGNVLFLSNTTSFDELYNTKSISDDVVLNGFLADKQPEGVSAENAKIAIMDKGRPRPFDHMINQHHPFSRAIPLRLKDGVKADVFSYLVRFEIDRMEGKDPLGVVYKLGDGAVIVYYGNIQTISSELNVKTDAYVMEAAKLALRTAKIKFANIQPDPEKMFFMNYAGSYITVLNKTGKPVRLSRDAESYGGRGKVETFEPVCDEAGEFKIDVGDNAISIGMPKGREYVVLRAKCR